MVPDGPWMVHEHFDRPDTEAVPTPEEQDDLQRAGFILDDAGRPQHPWFEDMVKDPALGVVFGKGAYWGWGPRRTGDSLVVANDHLALIRRHDTDDWALPGGHLNKDEAPEAGARRELGEETGLWIPDSISAELVYEGEVADIRIAQGWPVTFAYLFKLAGGELPEIHGSDDAKDAEWVPLDAVADMRLFGAHRLLVAKAVELL